MSIQQAKFHRPPVPSEFVERDRLDRALDQGTRGPLTLVVGPPGFGKSTLVSNWFSARSGPSAWLSLDEQDGDLQAFCTHFVEALCMCHADACPASAVVVDEGGIPDPAALVDELETLPEPLTLVLDDYSQVSEPRVHEFLGGLLRRPSRSLRLVLVTRRDPPLGLARLRVKGWLTEVRQRSLAFSREETAELLKQAFGVPVKDDVTSRVHGRVEGWPAAIRLVLLASRETQSVEELMERLPRGLHQARDFLGGEVFAREEPEVREYLLACSILDRFNASLCEAVRGEGGMEGRAFLDHALAAGLFLVPLDDQEEWYRFHPLFRECLLKQVDETTQKRLHGRAHRWFDAEGDIGRGVRHALAAGQLDAAVDTLWRHRHGLANEERWSELMELVRQLPDEVQEARVEPMLLRAAWVPSNLLPDLLARIEARMPADADPDLVGWQQSVRAYDCYDRVDAPGAEAHAVEALRLLGSESRYARASVHFLIAQTRQITGDRAGAVEAARRGAVEFGPGGGSPYAYVQLAHCYVHWAEAEFELLRQPAVLAMENGKVHARGIARGFLATWHAHQDELEEAERVLRHPEVDAHGDTVCLRALIQCAQGRVEAAEATAEELLRRASHFRLEEEGARASVLKAELALRSGRPDRALDWARAHRPDPPTYFHHHVEPTVTRAKVLVATGAEGAEEALAEVRGFAERTHNRRILEELARCVEETAAATSAARSSRAAAATGNRSRERLLSDLTGREFEVLDLLAERLSNKEIAVRLYISPQTVKHHTLSIYQKLHVRKRQEAVHRATELGLLT